MSAPRAVIGVDPGASTGIAVVLSGAARPSCLGTWECYGTLRRRWDRLEDAVLQAYLAAAEHVAPELILFAVEDPPPASRRRSLAGDKRGQRTWAGIGRYQGMALAASCLALRRLSRGSPPPILVPQREWRDAWLPAIHPSKVGDGGHRVVEAERLVEGVDFDLIAPARRVDAAEAVLLAGAVLRTRDIKGRRRGQEEVAE